MDDLDPIWKTKDCFDCQLKRDYVCYWGVTTKQIWVSYPDGTLHKRQKCLKRWKPQPEGHVGMPPKGKA